MTVRFFLIGIKNYLGQIILAGISIWTVLRPLRMLNSSEYLTLKRTAANDRRGRKPDLASEPLWTAFGAALVVNYYAFAFEPVA